jgi:hypothetical protein
MASILTDKHSPRHEIQIIEETGVYNVEDDVASIVCQALVEWNHMPLTVTWASIICQALPKSHTQNSPFACTISPRTPAWTAACARTYGLMDCALHVIEHIVNPRLLSQLTSYDIVDPHFQS